MEKTGIDCFEYAQKQYSLDDKLPWSFIDTGINNEFLKKEFHKALNLEQTSDCTMKCSGCGVLQCHFLQSNNSDSIASETFKTPVANNYSSKQEEHTITTVRFCHAKTGLMKYLSQLELSGLITRALRMAEIPFVLSHGFHPKPEISFGPSLSVGIESEKEYFDLKIYGALKNEYIERLNSILPDGLKIIIAREISSEIPSLNSFIKRYKYIVDLEDKFQLDKNFIESLTIKRNEKTVFLKDFWKKFKLMTGKHV